MPGRQASRRAVANWERVLNAIQRRDQLHGPASSFSRYDSNELGGFVPPSLGQATNIDAILQVANEIQSENPTVARILCEHAYYLSQDLDPNSEGRGVLQFKTGLLSVIKQKLAKKDGEKIDRTRDIALLEEFYKEYRKRIDEIWKAEGSWKASSLNRVDLNEMEERKNRELKKIYGTLSVLKDVIDALTRGSAADGGDLVISQELKDMMKNDAAAIEQFKVYNIIPLDAPGMSDDLFSAEIKAAMKELDSSNEFLLPEDFDMPQHRPVDIFDVMEYIFGFQRDNANNQREHLVLLLANAQSRLATPEVNNPKLDESAVNKVCEKILDNYNKWCEYLREISVYKSADTKKKKLFLASLYLLIWGEAANVRFLPECLCYIFHKMTEEMHNILESRVSRARSCTDEYGTSFLVKVITPIYTSLAAEAAKCNHGKNPHSKWRNYDDFNEYFWSSSCFNLKWPLDFSLPFFSTGKADKEATKQLLKGRKVGKSSFVEHRTFFHLYHSFHRLWIFLVMAFQGLAVIAFSEELWDLRTVKGLLSLVPTFLGMKLLESVLDIILMVGAYKDAQSRAVARIFIRFLWFTVCSGVLTYLYLLVLKEGNSNLSSSSFFKFYMGLSVVYLVAHVFITLLLRVPAFRARTRKCGQARIIEFLKWMHEEQYYVGRDLYEKTRDYLKYLSFWIVVLGCKMTFSYFLQIHPLVAPTKTIYEYRDLTYTWHDFISKGNHNLLTIATLWGPVVMIYLLDIQIWYTIFSSIVGVLVGTQDRLGEVRSLEMLRNRFENYPDAFVRNMHPLLATDNQGQLSNPGMSKANAIRFAPYWNQIIVSLREEDYISNREKELLLMPLNLIPEGKAVPWSSVQWPLFLLASKVFSAVELAADFDGSQADLWERIRKDEYTSHAVEEVYYGFCQILINLLNEDALAWIESLMAAVQNSIHQQALLSHFRLKKLSVLLTRMAVLLGLLGQEKNTERENGAVKELINLYDVIVHDVLLEDARNIYNNQGSITKSWKEGRLFSALNWPSSPVDKSLIKRLYHLVTIKESAASVPVNLEARRRLQFFTNSLFMTMPKAKTVHQMRSFCVFTPYYSEDVMYTTEQLQKPNEDGISTLFYLQKIFPDEWKNFLERRGCKDEDDFEAKCRPKGSPEALELRLWASYRGQTLARTVRGMMYYRRALMLQSFMEARRSGETNAQSFNYEVYQRDPYARAEVDSKFTYVVTCQIYGQQKQKQDHRAADILFLMQKNEGLRVAFIDTVEVLKEKKTHKEYFSKLVKADVNGKDQEIYKIKLPGDPKLGEGKPENQNHAIIFTRGNAIQTIDMNQDNYFEEALKIRNLLEEFGEVGDQKHGLWPVSILGVREHVFTGSVSSLAWFMSNQEGSFVTLGQRVLARPLKVRMHYGHPDVFDRVFHITRGGISKASRIINISEDIFAGFNSTLRQGNITHHEYIQVGKGRDVGLNQIAMFEGKVAGGNGEQTLSRDIYRLGQLFDFFRMLSFYVTSVGFYVCTMMTVWTVYIFLYGKAYLAFSGIGSSLENRAEVTSNTALQSALDTQFLFQIGVFTAIPMIMGFILEQGAFKAIINFVTMQLQLCSVFFTFSLGTRTHYFGRTILHGGAKYRATGRGFVVQHIKFAENYRLYSRSHFVKALEIVILLLVYAVYGFETSTVGYILLSFSSWFLAISWLFAPYIFNPAGFEWQKTVEDFSDWTNWLLYKGGVGVKGEESWETWWDEEQEHIITLRGKILETILSLRFFFFQFGVVYKLHAANNSTSLGVYGISWGVLVVIVLLFKVFTFSQKASVNFQMILRLIQGVIFVFLIVSLTLLVVLTRVSLGDLFASLLALLPTGWAIISIAIAWKPFVKKLGLWKSIRTIARFYDAAMGLVIFLPIAMLSWLPFVSTFQTRLVFNQAFSRGLEISLILAGNQPNSQM